MIKLGGTVYRLHPLFTVLMAISILAGYFTELLTLFGIVLIHEMGHVAAAKHFDWRVREVVILPFGGVASTEESDNIPAREDLIVTVCGPLQNVWMAGFAFWMKETGFWNPEWWDYFCRGNVMIAAFNLLPVLPLDGGKLVQAFLSYHISYYRTLVLTIHFSLWFSLLLVVMSVALLFRGGIALNLLLVGLFLFVSNWVALRQVPYRFLRFLVTRKSRLGSSGKVEPIVVPARSRPQEVFQLFMRDKYHCICLTRKDGSLLRVLPEEWLIERYFRQDRRSA